MFAATLPRPLGRYTLLRRLAVGGMAEVYLARAAGDFGFEKLVAIKRVHPDLHDGLGSASLAKEAKLAVALSHPNIVQTLDLDRAEGADFIVMEHVDGYDAQRVMDGLQATNREMPVDLAAWVVAEGCRGLDYAHRRLGGPGEGARIIHRDVSPQNVLISASGEVKVADFGIAKDDARRGSSEDGTIRGKYFYMSPEQARGEALDHRTDVFSAGIVLWELLVGERLYRATSLRSLLAAVRDPNVPRPSSRRAGLSPTLDRIVERATATRVEDRYETAGAMADDLERYLAGRPNTDFAGALGELVRGLEPPPRDSTASMLRLPRTRQHAEVLSSAGTRTPREPPLEVDLDDGAPTWAGRPSPRSSGPVHSWLWLSVAGGLLVGAAAWLASAG